MTAAWKAVVLIDEVRYQLDAPFLLGTHNALYHVGRRVFGGPQHT